LDLQRFRQKPLMGILRGVEQASLEPLLETAIASGLETLEITMNTPGAPALIAHAVSIAGERMAIGAGTVLDGASLEAALAAGAGFIVMPTLVEDVVSACVARGVPVFPGALTPQEIHDAWRAGASMVKVFPAKFFGPSYFREIKGPFNDVLLLACGGVSAANLAEFSACGADAFAFGGSVFDLATLGAGDFAKIGDRITALVEAWQG
jgi:2-dehydro-3-deoxyphosphogluconate aldolase/(4S)-4-hydroxy-2-oxoglutarate aldolase